MKNKKNVFFVFVVIQFLIYYFLFIHNNIIPLDNFSSFLVCFIVIINSYIFIETFKFKKSDYFSKKTNILLLCIINLIISFFISGKSLFMNSIIPININLYNLFLFILVNINLFPFLINILYFIDNYKIRIQDNYLSHKKILLFSLTCFLIIFLSCFIIAYGFYPGNMTSDSIDQWSQAIGFYKITSAHSPFYTIIMKFIFLIGRGPFFLIIMNISFLAFIVSKIMTYFYKLGISKIKLISITIIFTLCCNNLSMITILWKDIPFTISLLWLTFEIFKITREKKIYFEKHYNVISLLVALLFTYFFRVNGIFPYYISIIFLMFLLFKFKNKIKLFGVIVSSILMVFIVKYFIYNYFKVYKDDASSGTLSFIAKGMGSLIYYNANTLNTTKKISKKILPKKIYRKNYNPYNIDTYSFGKENWNAGLSKVTTKEMFVIYLKETFHNTRIIFRDRLDSNNLLWSYMTPDDGFNNTYVDGVWFPSNYDPSILNLKFNDVNNNYYSENNTINSAFRLYRDIFDKNSVLYIIFWRSGFSLSLFLILFVWTILRKKNYFPMFLPSLINILFWVLFLSHQSYRYVWFIFINTFFLFLFILFTKHDNKCVGGEYYEK